jgi:16S rRNA (adenine1518-N6/adenine1519-N6)-dimethyltransferase
VKKKPLAPKKRLGQNFLHSSFYARRIADSVNAKPDSTVVEVGPGMGALTVFLKNRFEALHLIEMDREIIPALEEKLGEGSWTMHAGDVLAFDFASLKGPLHIVGNLPYNIGALIIKKALLCAPHVVSLTCMVQREVAERIVAKPHSKQNGFLSIFCQFFGNPKILFRVPPGSFFPKPKVESAVFQLIVDPLKVEKLPKKMWEPFFAFVSRGFSMRRKKLMTTLAWKTGDKERYGIMLETLGLDRSVRPEDLGIAEWLGLYKQLEEQR